MKLNKVWSTFVMVFTGVLLNVSAQAQRAATATPTVVNGFVIAITVTDGGAGYTDSPKVHILEGGGTGALAIATVLNGAVNKVIVQNAGSGYTVGTPTVTVDLPPSPKPPFSDGLVAYYPFNGNGDDIGQGQNPMLLTDTAFGADRFGETGKALFFDGIKNSFARSTRIVTPQVADSFTMSIWAQPEQPYHASGYASGGNILIQPIHGSVNYGPGNAGVGLLLGTDGVGIIAHSDNYDPMAVEYRSSLIGWQHIVVRYDQKRPSLFVNGKLVASAAADPNYVFHPSSGDPNISGEFWIPIYGGVGLWAQWNNPGQLWDYSRFSGSVDDFRIYDRALTDQEVKDLYRYEAPERPSLRIEVQTVRVTLLVKPTKRYQLESSFDLKAWTQVADPILATSAEVPLTFNVLSEGQYFRIYQVQ